MRKKKEGQTYEIKNRMRPSGCPKCWHCGTEIGVVKLNSERWTRSEPEGRELTGDTVTAIRQSRKECIRDRETDG